MDVETIRIFCLSLPHVTEHIQWGEHLVFKVGGKSFAITTLGPVGHPISIKCTPEDFAELTEREGIVPAPYLARAKWVSLESFAALRSAELQEHVRRAHQLVLEKLPLKLKQQLSAPQAKAITRPAANKKKRASRRPKQ